MDQDSRKQRSRKTARTRIDRSNDAPTRYDDESTTATRIDPAGADSTADEATIKQHAVDPDASTHSLDPRVWAPLRVCPKCSLAWESAGDWCPSCGTAFDVGDRETERPASRGARSLPVRGRGTDARSPRTRGASAASRPRRPAGGGKPSALVPLPRRDPQSNSAKSGSRAAIWIALLLIIPVAAIAFVAGQQSRPSHAEVDGKIADAVQQTKNSAIKSYQRNFADLRRDLQAKFNKRVKAAEEKAYADGIASAKAEQQAQEKAQRDNGFGFGEDLKKCFKNFLLEC
jgi:hypothetical protein